MKLFTREIRYFFVVGVLAIVMDYLVYSLSVIFFNIIISKILGFIVGTVFAFLGNRKITFKDHDNILVHIYRFSILYTSTLFFNVTINYNLMSLLNYFQYKVQLSFIIATIYSATMNFIGMKYFVFTKKNKNQKTFEKN